MSHFQIFSALSFCYNYSTYRLGSRLIKGANFLSTNDPNPSLKLVEILPILVAERKVGEKLYMYNPETKLK